MGLRKFRHYNVGELVKHNLKGGVRALPVAYRGFRFRSRLEGRWAVFFDAIGIEYQYEPQGFQFDRGVCYLPDFYLPRVNTFAEVKPDLLTDNERWVCEQIVLATGRSFLYLEGPPDFRPYYCVSLDAGDLTAYTVSLDIGTYRKYYRDESRLFSCPSDEDLEEENVSDEYREAVYLSRGCRFDGRGR